MEELPFADNAPRFPEADDRGHVESYFLKANSRGGNRAVWIKHTVMIPKGRPEDAVAEVWAIAFRRGDPAFPVVLKSSTPLASASFRAHPFRAEHENGVLEAGRARGEISDGGHRIRWSLEFEASGPTHYPFPHRRLYTGPLPRTKTLTPVPDTGMLGAVEVDDHRWVLSGWRGMQGHNWGREHTPSYVWAHCNAWEDDTEAWFEGLSGKVRVLGTSMPWISTFALRHGGEIHRFDGVKALFGQDLDVAPNRWRFRALSRDAELSGVLSARREEMAGLIYENPDGSRVYCLNSKIASIRLSLRVGGGAPIDLRSRRAALEVGTTRLDHGVRIHR